MPRLDEVSFKLACGADVRVRVIVDTANCREPHGACLTAEQIAGELWLALAGAEQAPTRGP